MSDGDWWRVYISRWRCTPRCLERRWYVQIRDSHVECFRKQPGYGAEPVRRIAYAQAWEHGAFGVELRRGGAPVAWLRLPQRKEEEIRLRSNGHQPPPGCQGMNAAASSAAEIGGPHEFTTMQQRRELVEALNAASHGAMLLADVMGRRAEASARRASVIVVGRSDRHGGNLAVLLGAVGQLAEDGRADYRYGDFGGKLEGVAHSEVHIGAFRMLLEKLLGLASDESPAVAQALWNASASQVHVMERPGGFDCPGGHLLIVTPAGPLADIAAAFEKTQTGVSSAIDFLVARFKPNLAVETIALVGMTELLACAQDGVPYATPLSADACGYLADGTIWLRADMIGALASYGQ